LNGRTFSHSKSCIYTARIFRNWTSEFASF